MRLGVRSVFPEKNKDAAHHHTAVTKPTDSELSFFETRLEDLTKRRKDARILIIGSSPELRGLAAKNDIHATVIANDLEVIERTTKLMKKRNKHEEWLEGDITTLPLKEKSFDMIFGDHMISNVSPFNSEKFYVRMREILKNDGYVVMRSLVFRKTARSFERRILKHFEIVEKKFAKEGIFSEYFPIYAMKPK